MATSPTALRLTDDGGLEIDWSDGSKRAYSARELYAVNPAADARAEREKKEREQESPSKVGNLMLTVIKPEETQQRRVVGLQPVGNYAYMIRFNYGSSTGLYRLELLRELGVEKTVSPDTGSSNAGSSEAGQSTEPNSANAGTANTGTMND